MTANEKRRMVIDKYKEILGRNRYSKPLRDYCFKPYEDGMFYSDSSSSICYAYRMSGFDMDIMDTAGMCQSNKLVKVPAVIKNGQIKNLDILRIGDILVFAGNDDSRWFCDYAGHVEMIADIGINMITIYGHGSGTPSAKDMRKYCKSRYSSKANTPTGNRGLIRVLRFISDEEENNT